MLRTHVPDYRRRGEAELLEGLARRDPLALAEAYHRTVPAGNACARRLLGTPAESEALLQTVYHELWTSPPADAALERWVRARCFALAAEHLREVGRGPASPSAGALLPDLPAAAQRSHDPVEGLLAELDGEDRQILLAAHDQGLSTAQADDPGAAAAALERALLALAGADAEAEAGAAAEQATGLPLGDWVLGLLDPRTAERVRHEASEHADVRNRARILRRGRRRLEGLPPTPDMGQRIVATVLAGVATQPAPEPTGLVSALDTDLDGDGTAPAASEPFWEAGDAELDGDELPEDELDADELPEDGLDETELSEATTWEADEPEADTDEPWLWEGEEEDPRPKRRRGRRVLAFLGWLILIAVGIVAGMYVGSLLA